MARRPRRPLSLGALRGFESAARHASFTLAASELSLTQSSVSRQIQSLEEELGKPLFVRGTRGLQRTAAGDALYRVVRQSLAAIDRTVDEIRDASARRRVTVTTFASFASLWLVPRLAHFARLHPDIDIRIDATDALVDLDESEADVALRYCMDHQAPRDSVKLMDEALVPAVSPGLLERIGPLRSPADLARAPWLVLEDQSASATENTWERWFERVGVPQPRGVPRLVFNYIDQTMQAAARGQGVVLAKTPFLRDFVERGELVTPFAESLPSRYAFHLVGNPHSREAPHVKAFRDWVLAQR